MFVRPLLLLAVITFVGSPVTSHRPFRACRIRAFRVGHVSSESTVLVCCRIFSHVTARIDSDDPHLSKCYVAFLLVSPFDVYLGRFFIQNHFYF